MAIYALVLIFVCTGCVLGSTAPSAYQRLLVLPFITLLAAFSALRGHVGTDTYAYHEMFLNLFESNILEVATAVEPVFALIIIAVSFFSTSSFIFVGVIAIIQSVVLYLIVIRHSQPLLFLGLYAATFYLNFQFNILRAGLAALLLVLALTYLQSASKIKFFGSGLLSILSHYSSVLFFVPMSLSGQSLRWAAARALSALAVGGIVVWIFIDEGRWIQYLSYLVLYDIDEGVKYGFGLYAAFFLYAVIFALQVTRKNKVALGTIFLLWYATRLASNYILFVDRVEIAINIILLYMVSQRPKSARNSVPLIAACRLLIALNVYGSLKSLEAADQSTRGGLTTELGRVNSTYLPYKFAWEK